ncbi:response regulator [Bacillus sinesaloumensis]|uniref:response regulator n=1 Tax=Litchfieldia sinesaloumensis TaxID=1926280 RepID=UPI0009885547|nr:response regulator [Bacillus sinesaloumensis]
MVTVMLVDDEQVEREGLKLMLSKKRSNFEIVAEAKNGKQAVDFAMKHKPELIFMDIKMPEFDGLEAVKRIQTVLPHTKFIMVSAFDTFDYARDAMKFGIKEYLLKPSKVSEVLEAYDRMVEEIEGEKKKESEIAQINRRLERASSFIETEFIVSFIMDHVHEFNQKDWEEWLDLDYKQGFVAVCTFESDQSQPSREEKSHWYRVLKQSIHDQYSHCLVGPLTGFQVPVLRFLTDEEITDQANREEFARSIIHQVQHSLKGCRLLVGIGSIISDVNQFSTSYKEAIDALELVYTQSSASYMVFTERIKQNRKELVPFEIEKELVDAVKKGDSQKGLHMFELYFQSILQASDHKVRTVHKAIENFFIVLARSIKELGFEEDIVTSLGQFDTSIQIKEAAKTHLQLIIERLAEYRANGVQTLLLKAKEFLDKNYEKSISLDTVAEQVGISSYYLSKLFKERFQHTIIEYLTNIRLEKAKELLLSRVSLKEIALSIGYKDPNYFSRVFKKELGMSPSEYRAKYQR